MLYFSKLKIFLISLVCFASLYFAIPSFIPQNNFLSKFFPQTKLNLGLDLRGGSQLVLEVDFDYYIKEQIGNLKDEIKNEFRNESVRAVVESFDDKITFKIFDGEQEKLAKKSVTKISKKVEIDKIGNDFIVYFSDSEINLMRKNLIQQSIEIIRRRVDESGTKEPTIQAQGTNRILLQVPGVENSDEIKDILGQTAKMTFHFVADETFTGGTSNDPRLDAIMDDEGRTYFIKKEVALSGELLTDANPTYHEG